ncbi:MAG: C40 family peptidase [Bacteroidota bacterium]
MKYGVCTLSMAPVRKSPSSRSEMSNQLLFGDLIEILDRVDSWLFIRSVFDSYEGWLDFRQVTEVSNEYFEKAASAALCVCCDPVGILKDEHGNLKVRIVAGSSLPGMNDNHFEIDGSHYFYDGNSAVMHGNASRENICNIALAYLEAPYLWGGRSPFGIDCSGFVQAVFKIGGLPMKRDASQQAMQGNTISFLEESLPGDLVYFDNEEGVIIHTGILLENNKIIHSSGKVRIDNIDHEGIFNHELQKYTHRLRLIKSVIA